jgi:hypothetical protein
MDRIQSLGLMHALCEKTRRFEYGARRIVLFRCDNFLVVRKITILVPSTDRALPTPLHAHPPESHRQTYPSNQQFSTVADTQTLPGHIQKARVASRSSVEREGRGSQPSRPNLERLRPPSSRLCCRLPQTGLKYTNSTTSSFLFLVHLPLLPCSL